MVQPRDTCSLIFCLWQRCREKHHRRVRMFSGASTSKCNNLFGNRPWWSIRSQSLVNLPKLFRKWFKISTSAASWGKWIPKFITGCIIWCFFKIFCLNYSCYRKYGQERVPASNRKLANVPTVTCLWVSFPRLSVCTTGGWRGCFGCQATARGVKVALTLQSLDEMPPPPGNPL